MQSEGALKGTETFFLLTIELIIMTKKRFGFSLFLSSDGL